MDGPLLALKQHVLWPVEGLTQTERLLRRMAPRVSVEPPLPSRGNLPHGAYRVCQERGPPRGRHLSQADTISPSRTGMTPVHDNDSNLSSVS